MKNVDVAGAKQRLDRVFGRMKDLPPDPELQSHFARYLCVLVSGLLESSIRNLYGQYAKKKAAPDVANFVAVQLREFQNPKMEKILDLARAFNPLWEQELRTTSEGALKDAVDSIVANRHRIAHGEWVGLTPATLNRYYVDAFRVIEAIAKQCDD